MRMDEEGTTNRRGGERQTLHFCSPDGASLLVSHSASECFNLFHFALVEWSEPALIATRLFNKFKAVVSRSRNHSRSSARDDTTSDKMEQGGWQAGNPGPDTATGNHSLCSSQRCRGRLEGD